MRVLGIDTATWRASVGLAIDGVSVAERSQQTRGNHAASLLPMIDDLLRSRNVSIGDLELVAVSSGPGSFTGLRVALSVAKGLARAAGLPLVSVPTLEALARSVAEHTGVICPVLDARKGELYAAAFESAPGGGWMRLLDDHLVTPNDLMAHLPVPCTILGDAVLRYSEFFRSALGDTATVLPFESHAPNGAVVARLGQERFREHGASDLESAEPHYLRASEAETKAA